MRNDTEAFYDATAASWAARWYADETMLPLLKSFMELLGPGARVLDAGCGAGYESLRLAGLGAEVVGIDLSSCSIAIARKRAPMCRFEVMDCMTLDGSLGTFDGVAAIALIVHIATDSLEQLFARFYGVTRPGGYLMLAFRAGEGQCEQRSVREVDGVRYHSPFYLHTPQAVQEAAGHQGYLFHAEWTLPGDDLGGWRYLVFQSEKS